MPGEQPEPQDFEVLGVSLVGPPPIGTVHVRFEAGVTAMYGLNGAGKTAILRGIDSAMTGGDAGGEAYLHLRLVSVPDPEDPDEPDYVGLTKFLNELLDEAVDHREATEFVTLGRPNTDMETWEKLRETAGPSHPQTYVLLLAWLEGADSESAREIAEQQLFTLSAVGGQTPRWQVWASARVSEASPRLRSLLKEPGAGQERPPTDHVPGANWVMPKWMGEAPAWVPVPLIEFGPLSDPDLLPELVSERSDEEHIESVTREILLIGEAPLLTAQGTDVGVNPDYEAFLTALSKDASANLADLLQDAPVLRCELHPPKDWLSGRAVSWLAYDAPTMSWVPLARLSEAQRRWALISIMTAISSWLASEAESPVGCVLIDEPEAALHLQAQRRAVEGLKALASALACPVLVTTHSPVLLDDPDLRLLHVFRGRDGQTEIEALGAPVGMAIESARLGISRSDVLQLYRVFLVVEGEHDVAALEGVMGGDLAACRTLVLPIRGARRSLSALDSRILLDFTDATIVIALDRVRMHTYRLGWERARQLAAQGELAAAVRALKPELISGTEEGRILHDVCRRAVERGLVHRVDVFGFSEPDILQYLPVEDFVSDAADWKQVVTEWKSYRRSGGREAIKDWLRRAKGARLSTQSIRASAGRMDRVPPDFHRLLNLLRALASTPRATGASQGTEAP